MLIVLSVALGAGDADDADDVVDVVLTVVVDGTVLSELDEEAVVVVVVGGGHEAPNTVRDTCCKSNAGLKPQN